ncbi:MAG TPA: glycosyltransferase family 39 protein [Solirubrobacteraceae bacterium]
MTASRAGRASLVLALLIAALVIRVAHVESTSYRAVTDAGTFTRAASDISRTGDFGTSSRPGSGAGGSRGPTAYFPPAFEYFLAGVDRLDGHEAGGHSSVQGERIAQAVLGTVAVGLIGLVALEAFGPLVGIIALALAAFYPVLIEDSGLVIAENLLILFELGAVWTALRARRAAAEQRLSPYGWVAATGVLAGLAVLTHENAFLMLIPLGFAVWPGRSRRRSHSLGSVALLLLTAALTVLPWTIRNAVELHRFIPVSDETGITLVGAYNPDSAAFKPLPYKWRFFWKIGQDAGLRQNAGRLTEPQLGDRLLSQAEDYIGRHPLAPVTVGFRNTLRLLELAGPYAYGASAAAQGLHIGTARIGIGSFWILGVLALLGTLTPFARRAPPWLWAIPVLFVLSVVFINVETPRFREPIDPFVVMLAACALAVPATRVASRLSGSSPVRGPRGAALATRDRQLVEVVERLA